ncbi:MAG: hypothetical protein OEX77_09400 [Candidatus Bathyarchaeota archaeon]|nr:hypothetical protein [Candidatus Bathyarchaeota archaeon]
MKKRKRGNSYGHEEDRDKLFSIKRVSSGFLQRLSKGHQGLYFFVALVELIDH